MIRAEDRDHGFVLISVIWALVLLALIGAAAGTAISFRSKIRANGVQAAEVSALAHGLLRLTELQLTDRRPNGTASHLRVDGTPYECRIGNERASIRVVDTGGLVDLNAAPASMLTAMLIGVGLSAAESDRITAAIEDFRDADDEPRVGGAETAEYQAAGRRHGPKNGLFATVDELDQVLGISRPLFEILRPLVTVDSRMPGIDPQVAPIELLEAMLRGTGDSGAVGIERGRLNLPPEFTARTNGRSFVVRATIQRPNGATAIWEQVIELSPRSLTGFFVRSSSQPSGKGSRSTAFEMPAMQCPGWPVG